MYIKEIKFKNISGFKENNQSMDGFFKISFSKNINIIIGKNGAGKTTIINIIKFISFGYDKDFTNICKEKLEYPPYQENSEIIISIKENKNKYTMFFKTLFFENFENVNNKDFGPTYKLILEKIIINNTNENKKSIEYFLDDNIWKDNIKSELNKLLPLIKFFNQSKYFFINYDSLNDFCNDKNRYFLKYKLDTNNNLELYFEANVKNKTIKNIKKYFNIDLFYDSLPNNKTKKNITKIIKGDLSYNISTEASGILWIYNIILQLFSKDNYATSIIDEIEFSLHPDFQIKIMRNIKNVFKNSQIIISTHSPYIFKEHINNKTKLIIVKDNKIENKKYLKIFPWSPSFSEINYFLYDLPTIEFHNELYGYIENKIYTLPKSETRFNSKKNKLESVSLPEYIRHEIHHPENRKNKKLYEKQKKLKESIEIMLKLL